MPFLGGVTREVFCNAFGLNRASLRTGAEDMLRSEGEIGATLFAAASGLRGFRAATDTLEVEAADLFTPTARKRKLNEQIKVYEDAKRAAREERISGRDWDALNSELSATRARLADVTARRAAIAAETSRLKRLKATAPVLAVLDTITHDLARFADLPDLEARAADEIRSALGAMASGAEHLSKAERDLARVKADLAAIVADEAILSHVDAIDALSPLSGAFGANARDLPRVQAEADGLDRALDAVAVRLGVADAAAVEVGQPSDASRADLRRLLSSGRDIAARRLRSERELARLREELSASQGAPGQRVSLIDPAPLRTEYEALRPILADLGGCHDKQNDLARARKDHDCSLARLNPALRHGIVGIGALLPSHDTTKACGDAIAMAAQHCDRWRAQHEDLRDERWVNDQGVKDYLAFAAKYLPGADAGDINYITGYNEGGILVQLLNQAGDDLTRENIVKQMHAIKDLALPMLLPGVLVNTSETRNAAFTQLQLQRWTGAKWELFGDVVDGDASK